MARTSVFIRLLASFFLPPGDKFSPSLLSGMARWAPSTGATAWETVPWKRGLCDLPVAAAGLGANSPWQGAALQRPDWVGVASAGLGCGSLQRSFGEPSDGAVQVTSRPAHPTSPDRMLRGLPFRPWRCSPSCPGPEARAAAHHGSLGISPEQERKRPFRCFSLADGEERVTRPGSPPACQTEAALLWLLIAPPPAQPVLFQAHTSISQSLLESLCAAAFGEPGGGGHASAS